VGGAGAVELVDLRKVYGPVVALDCLSLAVEEGEFVTLLGPSGSGKTTTLMMIAGFEEPTAGRIHIGGRSVLRTPPYRRNIGVVFQSYALFPHMTVGANVAYPLRMRGVPRDEVRRRVARALELVQLGALAGRHPAQLSGGQQQRVALARALVFEPPLLLMDEPLGALDKKLREDLQLEIKRVHREVGVSVIYVTHDQSEALTMSDRIAVMRGGRLEQYGSAEDLYERPATRFVAEFIGEATLLPARVEPAAGGGLRASLAGGGSLRAARPGGPIAAGPATVVLRPEKLRLAEPAAGASNRMAGTVTEVLYLGDTVKYWVRTAQGTTVTVKCQSRFDAIRPGTGDQVHLDIDPRDVIVVPD
jgi:putative spermidine/putrescine transport system ATP-binding protein